MLSVRTIVGFASLSDAIEISAMSRKYIEYNLRQTYSPPRIRDLIRNKSKNVIVARRGRELAGFGIMTYQLESANLDLLAVDKPFRQHGIGMQLVQWLEKVARTAGIANIFVQVRKTNAGAVRFYQRLGFQLVDEVAGYYQGRESAMIMCKSIRSMAGGVHGFETGPRNR